jgi:hypothetical protein
MNLIELYLNLKHSDSMLGKIIAFNCYAKLRFALFKRLPFSALNTNYGKTLRHNYSIVLLANFFATSNE